MTTYRAVDVNTVGYLTLWLIPLAAVGGGLCAMWMLYQTKYHRIALWGRRLLAAGALLYYGHFLLAYDSIGMTGIGFWIGLIAAVVLFAAEPGLLRLQWGRQAGTAVSKARR
jgi:hypothetical protein